MSSFGPLTPARRDALLAIVALALLVGPVWASALHLGDPTYRYERARIVVSEQGFDYADEANVHSRLLISEEIGCSVGYDVRPCAFESYLAANHTVPTSIYAGNPEAPHGHIGVKRYRYVLVDGTVYETDLVANHSVQNSAGMYRLDLSLKPASPEQVLRHVSLDLSDKRDDMPPAVSDAATEGAGYAHRDIDVPRTPIRLSDGSYYRVYSAGRSEAPPIEHLFATLLTYVAPLVGLFGLLHLSNRVTITYVGANHRR